MVSGLLYNRYRIVAARHAVHVCVYIRNKTVKKVQTAFTGPCSRQAGQAVLVYTYLLYLPADRSLSSQILVSDSRGRWEG